MYNTKEEFLVEFQKWRENNNYPKRDECRVLLRKYRDTEYPEETIAIEVFDYILEQEKPGMFLDFLFKKGSSVCDSDPKPEVEKTTQEPKKSEEDYKLEVINTFYAYAQENKSVPSFKVLNSQLGYKVQKYFQDEKDLYYACATVHDIRDYLLNESMFSPEYTRKTLDMINKYKRFLVTTAVAGKKCNKLLLKSMLNYCERKDAIILVLPSQDVFNRKSKFEFELDPALKNDRIRVVYEDTYLNSNCMLSDIKVSAKQINPLHGLEHLCRHATTLVSSVKQDMKMVPNNLHKVSNAIMGTGSITEVSFSNDAYMSQRLNKLAEEDFVSGCIVVEIQDSYVFHFRQMQMDKDGGICDLGERFTPEGDAYFLWANAMVLGDLHIGEHSEKILNIEKEIIKTFGIKDIVIHDCFSGFSINPHERNEIVLQARKSEEGKISLKDEADLVSKILDELCEVTKGKCIVVDSNHNDFLSRYISSGQYAFDKVNLRYSLDIVKNTIDNSEDIPLRFMIEELTDFKNKDKVVWLNHDDEYKIYNTEVSIHGSRGASGSKGNLQQFRKAYVNSVSGHSHSPQIFRGNYCVGTSTDEFIGYNKGLSNWVPNICLIFETGTKQLINFIKNKNGEYTWKI